MTQSLRRSKKSFLEINRLYKRKKKKLTAAQKIEIEQNLFSLRDALFQKNRQEADALSQKAHRFARLHLKKSALDQVRDLVLALGFALIVATIVRSMWFEPYEIPSGSMRPTLKEQDCLVVSKTAFGINVPLMPKHFYFDPDLVKRAGIFVFTGENMDIRDVDTLYFYLFPGKKQFIKRLMGKPGDTLYFYGGQIYGIDAQGHDISAQLQPSQLDKIDHIPFIRFEGKMSTASPLPNGIYSSATLYQMNEPIARLFMTSARELRGEMLPIGTQSPVSNYGDLWGINNYAMARLLDKNQVTKLTDFDPNTLQPGTLYLELRHHPSLSPPTLIRDYAGLSRPSLSFTTSLIPLQEEHLKAVFANIYTARFTVKDGLAWREGTPNQYRTAGNPNIPRLSNVPDGTYEYYHGKAYAVKWAGITQELPPSHPLCQFTPELLQLLYNVGIEWDMQFMPRSKYQYLTPARYAYFRQGDLYLLGTPLLRKDDPILTSFIHNERTSHPTAPFVDAGPPLTADGTLDVALIKAAGLVIPPKSYLALGDNHAMSSDSRDFGFVPEDNLRGAPLFIFWPPQSRFGTLNQPPYPWFPLPTLVIWAAAALSLVVASKIQRRRRQL